MCIRDSHNGILYRFEELVAHNFAFVFTGELKEKLIRHSCYWHIIPPRTSRALLGVCLRLDASRMLSSTHHFTAVVVFYDFCCVEKSRVAWTSTELLKMTASAHTSLSRIFVSRNGHSLREPNLYFLVFSWKSTRHGISQRNRNPLYVTRIVDV